MQTAIKAAKIRAFIRSDGKTEKMVAQPTDFAMIACDMLRHRIVPNDSRLLSGDPKELDDIIMKIVNSVIPERE